jgi:ABC-type Fe3+/spermidine/putrescine transport system ATPase subunit
MTPAERVSTHEMSGGQQQRVALAASSSHAA